MDLVCTQPGGGCFDPIVGFGICIAGVIALSTCSVKSRALTSWMILDLARHRHYHDSVPRLGGLLD